MNACLCKEWKMKMVNILHFSSKTFFMGSLIHKSQVLTSKFLQGSFKFIHFLLLLFSFRKLRLILLFFWFIFLSKLEKKRGKFSLMHIYMNHELQMDGSFNTLPFEKINSIVIDPGYKGVCL